VLLAEPVNGRRVAEQETSCIFCWRARVT
jgi:hypothetical protein